MKPMSEADDFLKSGKKLNEFVEEEVEISTINPVLDEKNKRVRFEQGTTKVKQKTYYAYAPQKMIICKDHFFKPLDPKKYIFKCTRCDYHFKGNTLTHKYHPDTGQILLRHTNG